MKIIVGGSMINSSHEMLYFAYGLNTNLEAMQARCPAAQNLGAAVLPGYQLAFSHYCDIRPHADQQVHGVLWDITPNCLISLDQLEGYPEYYNRHWDYIVQDSTGKKLRAMAYFMQTSPAISPPSQYYLDSVTDGYKQHRLPCDQLWDALKQSRKAMLARVNGRLT